MGRGRQKAKQTKVARALKYTTPDTDYSRLQQELASMRGVATDPYPGEGSEDWSDDTDSDS